MTDIPNELRQQLERSVALHSQIEQAIIDAGADALTAHRATNAVLLIVADDLQQCARLIERRTAVATMPSMAG